MKILIVEDDTSFGLMLVRFLERQGFIPVYSKSSEEALTTISNQSFDLVLTDLKLPGMNGIELLKTIKQNDPGLSVVLMTSHGQVKTAVKAIKLGAFEYITKPIDHEELLSVLNEALKVPEKKALHTQQHKFITGISRAFAEVLDQAKLVAETNLSVLLLGESGTGKEQLARLIHQNSLRRDGPFVAVDCGALSKELAASELFGHVKGAFTGALQDKKGQFKIAQGGTIFLDEIGNLSYEVQIQLLRVLQEKVIRKVGGEKAEPIDVRIITATNEPLKENIEEGSFRNDLFHRINEFQIVIPPLRERKEDLEIFVDEFIQQSNLEFEKNVKGLSAGAKSLIYNYHWSGNIRELKNVIRRAVLMEKETLLQPSSLPGFLVEDNTSAVPSSDLKQVKKISETELIKDALERANFNKTKAAKLLNIDRSTLYDKIKKYNLKISVD